MEKVWLAFLDIIFRVLLSDWFWIGLCIVTVLYITVFIYRRLKLKALGRVIYSREFSTDGVFVGETLELIETIQNPGWFPLLSIKVEFFMPSGVTVGEISCREYTKLISIFTIPPFSTVKKVHIVRADRRDRYKLFSSTIKYRSFEYTFESEIEFFAYPDKYDADASFFSEINLAGNAVLSRKYVEDPFFVSGIRAYRIGDPLRSINFKASARFFSGGSRCLMCNDYDTSRDYDSMIFLDLFSYPEVSMEAEDQIEQGLRYACYLFCEAIKRDAMVGFSVNCSLGSSRYIYIPCGNGELHIKNVLERFAELSQYARRNYSMSAIIKSVAPDLPQNTDIYLITPYVDTNMADTLNELQRLGKNVKVINLAWEKKNEIIA